MSDIVERAKAALEGITEGPWATDGTLIGCELVKDSPGVTSYKHALAEMDEDSYDEEFGEGTYDGEVWRPYEQRLADAEFIAAARTLVPELVAEVERLRAGGPWVEHVERMESMKRHRDGDCICDRNPETSDGPDEFCPWDGRPYREVVGILEQQAAELAELRTTLRIESAEELDRVPVGAVVRSSAGTIACRFDGRNGVVFGDDRPFPWHKLALPAQLIWDPRSQR